MRLVGVTSRAVDQAAALVAEASLCPFAGPPSADELRTLVQAAVDAGQTTPTLDGKTGEAQTLVMLRHGGQQVPWAAAAVKGGVVTAMLRGMSALRLVKEMKRRNGSQVSLELLTADDPAVLLRFRSYGVIGVRAIEVMRDGTARYVMEGT